MVEVVGVVIFNLEKRRPSKDLVYWGKAYCISLKDRAATTGKSYIIYSGADSSSVSVKSFQTFQKLSEPSNTHLIHGSVVYREARFNNISGIGVTQLLKSSLILKFCEPEGNRVAFWTY